ncbi:hypothetical protein C8Q79DRAFT_954211 [Trametes meyenii]|nr:hypothetical protein C8Q79DRAFT_954211 [Trametes meyenii]
MDSSPSLGGEPPRKRQRTVERELSTPARSTSNSSAQAVPGEATADGPSSSGSHLPSTMSVLRPYNVVGTASQPRNASRSHLDADIDTPGPSSGNVVSGGSVLSEADTASDLDNETRRIPVRPGTGGFGNQGGAYDPAQASMKAGPSTDKGKAPASSAMSTLPRTQTHVPRQGPAALPSVGDSLGDGDSGRDPMDGPLDGARHAASGAGAKAMVLGRPGLAAAPLVESEATRDAEYYIEGADCAIRVEDTLFRVHRYFLGRDNSAFQHMYSMPGQGLTWHNMEGCSDNNPIRLYGESAERFRALLSVIYDLPPQLQAYNTPAADMDRLLAICEMTNKYHFASIETWAVDALYSAVSGLHGPPRQPYHLAHCSSVWMKRLLEVALLCGHAKLLEFVAANWVDRLLARDLRPVHALEIAARSGNKHLAGYAYYVQLLEMGPEFDPGVVEDGKAYARARLAHYAAATGGAAAAPNTNANNEPRIGTPAVLTREQKQRLLSGHWSLCRLWERLRTTPPKFERPDGCTYHQHGCLSTWAQAWRDVGKSEATLRLQTVDVLGRLKAMEEQLFVHADVSVALSPQCKRAAMVALRTMVNEVKGGLAAHFSDLVADGHDGTGGGDEAAAGRT